MYEGNLPNVCNVFLILLKFLSEVLRSNDFIPTHLTFYCVVWNDSILYDLIFPCLIVNLTEITENFFLQSNV